MSEYQPGDEQILAEVFGLAMRRMVCLAELCTATATFLNAHESIGGTVHLRDRDTAEVVAALRYSADEALSIVDRLSVEADAAKFREAALKVLAEKGGASWPAT